MKGATNGLGECLPGGSGSFFALMGDAQLQSQLGMFVQAMEDVKSSSTYNWEPLRSSQGQMSAATDSFVNAAFNDIKSDPSSKEWFKHSQTGLSPTAAFSTQRS